MSNVKLCLTPYVLSANDAIQSFFQNNEANAGLEYTENAFSVFNPIWQPGLDFWTSSLPQGQAQGWWRHPGAPNDTTGYEAVRTLGVYESNKEPSLCIDLDLLQHERAHSLLRSAASFGLQHSQTSVHALFSMRHNSVREAWRAEKLAARAKLNEVHLATFGGELSARTILNAALSVGMTGVTASIMRNQMFFYHPQGLDHTAKWNMLVKILRSHAPLEYEESWEALLFAIGDGEECTSKYTDWLG